jgi:hypothetical protein
MNGHRLAGALAAAGCVAITAFPTVATAAPQTRAANDALLRGAHLSPDTPSVDVYLTAFAGHTTTFWLSSVGYGDVSPYQRVQPGLYAVSMRAHGAKASSPAALSWTAQLRPGRAYTTAAIGMNSALHGIVLTDELTPPPAGRSRVRVIQAASRAPHAKVSAGGTVLAPSVAFGSTTSYRTIPAGRLSLRAASVQTPAVQARAHLKVQSGSVESLVVLDAKGHGIAIRHLVDAAGVQTVPSGPIPAGGGGTAATPSDGTSSAPAVVGGVLLVVAAAAGAVVRRGRRATAPR